MAALRRVVGHVSPVIAAIIIIVCAGARAAAQTAEACAPPCAPGQVCVKGVCMVPAQPPPPAPVAPAYGYPPVYAYPPAGYPPAYGYPPPYFYPRPVVVPARGPRYGDKLHDGFYLRGSIGASYLRGAIDNVDEASGFVGGVTASGPTFDGAIGGAPIPGLVLGALLHITTFTNPQVQRANTAGNLDLMQVGVMADVYPNPEGGFHLMGSVALGVVTWEQSFSFSSVLLAPEVPYSGIGAALVGATGYELWVGRQLSIGGLFRVSYESATLRPSNQFDRTLHTNVEFGYLCFALMATLNFQ